VSQVFVELAGELLLPLHRNRLRSSDERPGDGSVVGSFAVRNGFAQLDRRFVLSDLSRDAFYVLFFRVTKLTRFGSVAASRAVSTCAAGQKQTIKRERIQ
jgi:hypothetical protein